MTYKYTSALDWFEQKMIEHADNPQWLREAMRSLLTSARVDNDAIQDAFETEMERDGFFEEIEDAA